MIKQNSQNESHAEARRARRGQRAFTADQSGGTLVFFTLALSAALGMAGLGLNSSIWYLQKRQMQSVADLSATMATQVRLDGGSVPAARAAAQNLAQRNGFTHGVDGAVLVNIPPLAGAHKDDADFAEVIVSRSSELYLAAVLGGGPVTISSRAVSGSKVVGSNCVLSLDPSGARSVAFSGSSSADIDCGIFANSSHAEAVYVSGTATVTGDEPIATVGDIALSGSGEIIYTQDVTSQTGMNPVSDPYADLVVPEVLGCDNDSLHADDIVPLAPGTYCNGLTINAGADVTLDPGVYIIKGGDLSVAGGATVTGAGVTIVFTHEDGGTTVGGVHSINGGAVITLSAPGPDGHESGPFMGEYAGILFFQDPEGSGGAAFNKFNGGATMTLTGALYFPSEPVEFQGGVELADGCTQIIAGQVTFSGGSTINGTDAVCEDAGVARIGTELARLFE